MATILQRLETGPGEPAWNMAVDEALLATASHRATPILRFYGWTEPAATFGYFQHLADVERATRLRPLIRRPTGGGIVPHDRDWTYSLVIPPDHPWYRLSAIDSYREMHAWVVEGFRALGIPTELAPCCRNEAPGQCFRGWEQFDVLCGGRKIGGAAQRRNRQGLLVQGSVQPPMPADRATWESALATLAPTRFFSGSERVPLAAEARTLAEDLAETKYRQSTYNARR